MCASREREVVGTFRIRIHDLQSTARRARSHRATTPLNDNVKEQQRRKLQL